MTAHLPPHSEPLAPASAVRTVPLSGQRPDLARRHWLGAELVGQSTVILGGSRLSPSVVDIEVELGFWRRHHQRTAAWHRDVLPFNEYVPAFTLGMGMFLQCHDQLIEVLDPSLLATRYARVRRNSRVEWHEARQAVRAAFLRLQSHWQAAAGAAISAAEAPVARSMHPSPPVGRRPRAPRHLSPTR